MTAIKYVLVIFWAILVFFAVAALVNIVGVVTIANPNTSGDSRAMRIVVSVAGLLIGLAAALASVRRARPWLHPKKTNDSAIGPTDE